MSAEAFRRDYDTDLSNGGVFVPTDGEIALRTSVAVHLVLEFLPGDGLVLQGEVVHCVPRRMAALGGTPGVAVQFREPVAAIRERLAPLLASAGVVPPESADTDPRVAPRKPARLSARIEADEGTVAGCTRDLSRSGALVGVQRGSVSVGETVRIALRHPTTGATIEIDGRVVRGVESRGRISAVAVEFTPDPRERECVERFLEDVQSTEHVRRLGGIYGTLAEIGVQNLVQMFAGALPVGTLTLHSGDEEGTIGFQKGLLCLARLGPASGMKALVRMLGWREGVFEFHARLDEHEILDAPLPLEDAVLEAILLVEEAERLDTKSFRPEAHLVLVSGADSGEPLTKMEAALVDLARAGLPLGRAVDVIPEPDLEIHRALQSLLERRVLELR